MDATTGSEGQSARNWHDRVFGGVVFAGLFAYLWKGLEPHLLYYGFGVFGEYPQFSWDAMFLEARFAAPGGPLKVLTGFLAQWYYQSWLGAVIIVAVLWVLFLGTRRLLRQVGAEGGRDWAFLPPLLGLFVYNCYDHPLQALLAVSASVWLAVLHLSVPVKNAAIRIATFAFLYGLCYYLTGGAALVFGLTVCLAEGLSRRRIVCAGSCAALAVAATLVMGPWVFFLSPREAFCVGTPLDPGLAGGLDRTSRWVLWGLYAFVPAATLGTMLWGRWAHRASVPRSPGRVSATPTRMDRLRRHLPWLWVVVRRAAIVGLCIACMMGRRTGMKYDLAMHYCSRQRDWAGVIRLADQMRERYTFPPACIFDVDRALAHLGRMGDDLFAYPQNTKVLAFLSLGDLGHQFWFSKLLDLHFDLGDLNAAEQDAYELLEVQGPSPYVLEALARVHIAKGEYEAARVPLKALRTSPAFRAVASRWLEELADPARLAADPNVASWRRWRRQNDHEVREAYYDQVLLDMLSDHPDNRLAFEYLTGYYLLTHQRAKLVENLRRLRELGYDRLPRHYAEALLIYLSQTRKPIDMQGWTIDPGATDRLEQITTVWKGMRGDRQAAMAVLAPRFGDTYTYYSIFSVSGVK